MQYSTNGFFGGESKRGIRESLVPSYSFCCRLCCRPLTMNYFQNVRIKVIAQIVVQLVKCFLAKPIIEDTFLGTGLPCMAGECGCGSAAILAIPCSKREV